MVCVWVCAELKLLPTDRGVPSLPAVVTVSEKPAEAVTVFERVAPTITIIKPVSPSMGPIIIPARLPINTAIRIMPAISSKIPASTMPPLGLFVFSSVEE